MHLGMNQLQRKQCQCRCLHAGQWAAMQPLAPPLNPSAAASSRGDTAEPHRPVPLCLGSLFTEQP